MVVICGWWDLGILRPLMRARGVAPDDVKLTARRRVTPV